MVVVGIVVVVSENLLLGGISWDSPSRTDMISKERRGKDSDTANHQLRPYLTPNKGPRRDLEVGMDGGHGLS